MIIADVKTDRSEPLEESMTLTRMGIDATKPYNLPPQMFETADVPKDMKERIGRRIG